MLSQSFSIPRPNQAMQRTADRRNAKFESMRTPILARAVADFVSR
jgi:hypothetical protein